MSKKKSKSLCPNDQAFLALAYLLLHVPSPSHETALYLRIVCSYVRQFLAETLGTFLLVVLGDGSVAQVRYILY
jgi:hypothetical protein